MPDAPANTPPPRISRLRPRLRKAAKWVTLILSILLVAAWAMSAWVAFAFFSKLGIAIGVDEGVVLIGADRGSPTAAYQGQSSFREHSPGLRWLFGVIDNPQGWVVLIPFWAITLPAIALTIFAWRRDAAARRRLLVNHCPACNYDRAGLSTPGALCPECGAAAPTVASATQRTARPTR